MNQPIIVVSSRADLASIEGCDRIVVVDDLGALEREIFEDVRMIPVSLIVTFEHEDDLRRAAPIVLDRPQRDWENNQRRRMKPRRR